MRRGEGEKTVEEGSELELDQIVLGQRSAGSPCSVILNLFLLRTATVCSIS